VLRYGSLLATVLMAIGLILALYTGETESLAAAHRINLVPLIVQAVRLKASAVAQLGLLILLLTPMARIIAAAVSFALEGDAKYFLVSSSVLAIVLVSISLAVEM